MTPCFDYCNLYLFSHILHFKSTSKKAVLNLRITPSSLCLTPANSTSTLVKADPPALASDIYRVDARDSTFCFLPSNLPLLKSMNAILSLFLGLVPGSLKSSFDFSNSDESRHYYIPIMQSSFSPSATKEHKNTPIPPSIAPPPAYNDVCGGPVIINQDGEPQFLSPEEEVERQHRLQQAVREKMLGLPRTTKFEWYQRKSGMSGMLGTTGTESEELPLPLYTPREDEK